MGEIKDSSRTGTGLRLSRRGVARSLGGGLASLATGRAVAAPGANGLREKKRKKRRKKRKFRTITRTFTNPAPISLPDNATAVPYPSTTLVTGFRQGKLLDVNVTLRGLSHDFVRDLDLLLQAPNGRRAIVMSDVGALPKVTDITLTIDDQAAARLPEGAPLGPGRFKPANYFDGGADVFPPPGGNSKNVRLATFKGIDLNGPWRLLVVEDFPDDSGEISAGWSLKIKARVRKDRRK